MHAIRPITYRLFILLPLLLACGVFLSAGTAQPPNIATFSVVAYNPATGEVGVAVQSRFFAVGSVVPWARAGVGAVASQAMGNPTYGERGLVMMAQGVAPEEAIQSVLRDDADRERRQIGMVSVACGRAATFTGGECMAWAGGKSGYTPEGIVYTVQGNILAGPGVVDAMAAALAAPPAPAALGALTPDETQALAMDDFAARLLAALLAGQAAGGDSRGMQSAALKVCQTGMGYGGYSDVKYDLRVDDAADPFSELARLLNLARPLVLANEDYMKLYTGSRADAITIFQQLVQLQPQEAAHHYNLACAYSLTGMPDEAMAELTLAAQLDPQLLVQAPEDRDLVALREREDFKALIGTAPAPPATP